MFINKNDLRFKPSLASKKARRMDGWLAGERKLSFRSIYNYEHEHEQLAHMNNTRMQQLIISNISNRMLELAYRYFDVAKLVLVHSSSRFSFPFTPSKQVQWSLAKSRVVSHCPRSLKSALYKRLK